MPRICPVSLKKTETGCNVSHANNKTRRVFLPNLHPVTFFSVALDRRIPLRLATKGIKTVEKYGGLDGFLQAMPKRRLSGILLKLQKELLKKGLIVKGKFKKSEE